MSKYAVTVRNLLYSYPGQKGSGPDEPAVNIKDLKLEQGKVTVFRGHNGSGKTTFLKILAGLIQPDQGEIVHTSDRKTVLVQQEPYLFHGSVSQNLVWPLKFSGIGIKNRESLVREKLRLVGLEGFEKRKARELSGGEKKRIAIARALMTEARTILLDEPDANVDSATTQELEKLIRTLSDQGMSIILCSHQKSFAYRCSDRIIDLFQGSPVSHDENIFKGQYRYSDGIYSDFAVGNHMIHCPGRQGEFSTIVIPPDNISVSREAEKGAIMGSGKENRLQGTILSVQAYKEGRFTVTVDCGLIMKVRMSSSLISMLNLRESDTVRLLFNPSSVRLY
ncbi:MAG: ATP-binding cassette domain-containing protein [Spirochaetales bacterium]|nr:ATP-binding cassette domain-containing protein [Spirochaetales bacterium]